MKSSKSKVHPSTMPSKLTAKAPATTSHIATNIPATPAKSTNAKANNTSVSAKAVSPDTSVKMVPQEQKKTQNEKVSMKQSKQSPEIAAYQFEWKHGGNDVKITGTFDSWEIVKGSECGR
ncbi:hypothetical protein BGZ98_007765 [Dissophora globulifera]|nr:hypothetical protein BGZ98_007765 [Dissophora globulifera]